MKGSLRYGQTLLVLLVAASLAGAADAPIRLPNAPTPPVVPTPMPSPDAAIGLVGNQFFVIDSDVECVVKCIPSGIVRVANDNGPLRVKGRFVDGNTGVESREYKGKFLYHIEPMGTGKVTILVIPKAGVKEESDVLVRVLDVDANAEVGRKPCPEPKPPAPEPKPVDPPTPAKSLRVFLVFESGDTLTAAQRGVLYGKAVEEWLNANCTGGVAGWRRRDKDSPGEADLTMAAMWAAVQPKVTVTPCVAVERDGKIELINVEGTPAKMVEVLNSYKAGK